MQDARYRTRYRIDRSPQGLNGTMQSRPSMRSGSERRQLCRCHLLRAGRHAGVPSPDAARHGGVGVAQRPQSCGRAKTRPSGRSPHGQYP